MSDIALDLNPTSSTYNDLLIQDGDLVITATQLESIQQHVLQRLRIYLGEWFLDNTIGLPFFQQILVKNPDKATIDGYIQDQILATPGVVQLNSYAATIDATARTLSISFSALTTSGIISYNGLL
jgi:hypothetical protein